MYFFNSPDMVRRIIESHSYVVMPPEGPRPPASREELHEYELKRQQAAAAATAGGRRCMRQLPRRRRSKSRQASIG